MRIAFQRPMNLYDWAIACYTRGPFSHCEVRLDNGMFVGSRPSTGVAYQPYPHIAADWVYVDVPLALDNQRIRVQRLVDRELGCAYDFMGVARFVLPFLQPSRNRWFCSEFAVSVLQSVGLLSGRRASAIDPNTLFRLLADPVNRSVRSLPGEV